MKGLALFRPSRKKISDMIKPMWKFINWLLVIGWMGVIYWFSDQSQLISPTNPLIAQTIAISGHIIFFGILYFLFTRAVKANFKSKYLLQIGLLFVFLYGVSDEYHQSFVPGRDVSILDVGLDVIGGWLASMLKLDTNFQMRENYK